MIYSRKDRFLQLRSPQFALWEIKNIFIKEYSIYYSAISYLLPEALAHATKQSASVPH
jgi:hypothetical protein